MSKVDESYNDADSDDESSYEEQQNLLVPNSQCSGGHDTDNMARLRKEKRLAMNRESARNRRKRKKVLIQSLESQVSEVSKSREELKSENEKLKNRLQAIETELQIANATIASLITQRNHSHRDYRLSEPFPIGRLGLNNERSPRSFLRGGHLLPDESTNQVLQSQLASILQQERDQQTSTSSMLTRDNLLRQILDPQTSRISNNLAGVASSRENLNFFRNQRVGDLMSRSAGISDVSLENMAALNREPDIDNERIFPFLQAPVAAGLSSRSLLLAQHQQRNMASNTTNQRQEMLLEELLSRQMQSSSKKGLDKKEGNWKA